MRVLVTGANGQLGYALQKTARPLVADQTLDVIALTRAEMDLSQLSILELVLEKYSPDVVINTAAYTAVDKAESEPVLAQVINADAVGVIADWCEKNKKILVQVSTDFVFDGQKSVPYELIDQTNPTCTYGLTKQKGEQVALSKCSQAYVVRTGWVYCEHGSNFVKTILRLAAERDQLGIVGDQVGTPTYALHLAEMIWQLLLKQPSQKLWHFSDAGVASWYDFAVAIVIESKKIGLLDKSPAIKPIRTSDYPTPAQRPAFSVLNKKQTWDELNVVPIHWQQALTKMLIALKHA